jgi:glycosyltransferase involved in cell wall biosynthesis
MPIISIIVPVYKVEPYLRRCLDSVLAQVFTDYECILVDDASPDNCLVLCDEYAEKDSRFRVIHKTQNEGLPKARKSGLDIAKSEFVFHLDSDDWLEPNALEALYVKQQEMGSDVVIGGCRIIYPSGNERYIHPALNDETIPLEYFLIDRNKAIWGRLYKRSLYSDYIVPSITIGEDVIVNIQVFSMLKTGRLHIIDEIIYNYDYRTGGVSQGIIRTYYSSYLEYPPVICRLWIESYLIKTDKNSIDAYNYCIINEAFNQYLRFNKIISRKEVNIFYQKYYTHCTKIKNIPLRFRFIIPIFYFSCFIGKIYVFFLNKTIIMTKFLLKYLIMDKK